VGGPLGVDAQGLRALARTTKRFGRGHEGPARPVRGVLDSNVEVTLRARQGIGESDSIRLNLRGCEHEDWFGRRRDTLVFPRERGDPESAADRQISASRQDRTDQGSDDNGPGMAPDGFHSRFPPRRTYLAPMEPRTQTARVDSCIGVILIHGRRLRRAIVFARRGSKVSIAAVFRWALFEKGR